MSSTVCEAEAPQPFAVLASNAERSPLPSPVNASPPAVAKTPPISGSSVARIKPCLRPIIAKWVGMPKGNDTPPRGTRFGMTKSPNEIPPTHNNQREANERSQNSDYWNPLLSWLRDVESLVRSEGFVA